MHTLQEQLDLLIATHGYASVIDALAESINNDYQSAHRYRRDLCLLASGTLNAIKESFNFVETKYGYTPGKKD